AAGLRAVDDPARTSLLIDLGGVLREEGQFIAADDALGEALALAHDRNDTALENRARLERLLNRLQVDPEEGARAMSGESKIVGRALVAAADRAGLAGLGPLRALLAGIRAQAGDAAAAWRRAADEAHLAGDDRILADAIGWEASAVMHGPTPAADALD